MPSPHMCLLCGQAWSSRWVLAATQTPLSIPRSFIVGLYALIQLLVILDGVHGKTALLEGKDGQWVQRSERYH